MVSVELRRVSKVYSGTTAVLDQLDLRVDAGELLVLLGPNGSGKTTLLRVIAGLERATSGEVWFGGKDVTEQAPRQRGVAMMFQSGVLYPHLTVERNLRFGTSYEGGGFGGIWSRLTNLAGSLVGRRSDHQDHEVLQDRVRETAQLLGIESLLKRLPRQLSGGERQRVALGRALVRQPAVFLLDEPFANADTRWRQEMREVFQRARQRFPATMILVSHDHTEALALGQRIAILDGGKIQQVGTAEEVYAAPRNRMVAEFLGRSSVRFLEGQWERDGGTAAWVCEWGRWKVPPHVRDRMPDGNRRVTLGLRSEAVSVCPAGQRAETEMTGEITGGMNSEITGEVRWVELQEGGAAAYVELRGRVDGNEPRQAPLIAARVPGPASVQTGTQVQLVIDWNRALWFDSLTGKNLAVSDPVPARDN